MRPLLVASFVKLFRLHSLSKGVPGLQERGERREERGERSLEKGERSEERGQRKESERIEERGVRGEKSVERLLVSESFFSPGAGGARS